MSSTEIRFDKVRGSFTSAFVKVVKVTKVSGGQSGFSALVYQCKMNVDWDGAPTAYGMDNPREAREPRLVWSTDRQTFVHDRVDHFQRKLAPLEYAGLRGSLRDATNNVKAGQGLGFDHNFLWVGVVSADRATARRNNLWIDDRAQLQDQLGRFPVIQKDGPTKGYYVSQSGSFAISLADRKAHPGSQFLQSSYWDASRIPYCVWPSLLGQGLALGDFGLVIANDSGKSGGFFFADTGSTTKVGECSGFLVTQVLGSPLNNDRMVSFIVFPGSGGGAPTKGRETLIKKKVSDQVAKLSGVVNAEELIRFLAMGADPDTFAKAKYDDIKYSGYFPKPGTPADTYENLHRALKDWGFESARKPIDINAPLQL
jgi:hypothetical protein